MATYTLTTTTAAWRALNVPAVAAVYAGHLTPSGDIVAPCRAAARSALPYRWRKAWDRSTGSFWFNSTPGASLSPAYVALHDYRGRHLATIYANLNPED